MGGFQNQKNVYTCAECRGQIVTIDVDDGTTPMQIECKATPGCTGGMFSSWYQVAPDAPAPSFEWYRPSAEETRQEERRVPGTAEHVRLGGLLLRPRKEAA